MIEISHRKWFYYFNNQWDSLTIDEMNKIHKSCCQKLLPKEYQHELFEFGFDDRAVALGVYMHKCKIGNKS